jgi:superfamily II DNA/RNA helicase
MKECLLVREQLAGIKDLFDQLTGSCGFQPYPYQERVAEHLLSGRNVILSAPTGAGKTWAALLPFLYAKRTGVLFVDRLIFALPLRTLATSIFQDTATACQMTFGKDAVVTVGKGRDYQEIDNLYPTSCFFAILGAKSYHFGMLGRVISIG